MNAHDTPPGKRSSSRNCTSTRSITRSSNKKTPDSSLTNQLIVRKQLFTEEDSTPNPDREDASLFNLVQILLIKEFDSDRSNHFDFVKCSDIIVSNVFPSYTPVKSGVEIVVPFNKKHNASSIRVFQKLGVQVRNNLSSKIYSIPPCKSYTCLGLDRLFCSINIKTMKKKLSIMIGFENLVRESIRNRSNILRDNIFPIHHYNVGVVLSHQTKNELLYLLEEKDIKNENDRYNNFIFRSPNCVDVTNEDDVICLNCDKVKANFVKHLIRSDGRVDASQKLKTRNDITLCSPTLEKNKLEMYSNKLKVHRDKTSRAKIAHQKV